MSRVQIVNFQTTPYSDDVSVYINSLSADQIYHIFNENVTADILTAALYAIYKLESDASFEIKQGSSQNSSYVLREAQKLCPNLYKNINLRTLDSLSDIYRQDNLLLSENINELGVYPNVFVLNIDGLYSKHAYTWIIKDRSEKVQVTNVTGIRSSLLGLLINSCCEIERSSIRSGIFNFCRLRENRIVSIFLDAIYNWSKNQGVYYVRVLQPIGPMPKILMQCGFIMTKTIRNQEGMNWLFDNSSIGDTSLANNLIFREYDYLVTTLSDKIRCVAPTYEYKQL